VTREEEAAQPIRPPTKSDHWIQPPLHPVSSLLAAFCDGLWTIPEVIAAASVIGLPLVPILALASGLTCAVAVAVSQKLIARDAGYIAGLKGLAMGAVAAIPIPLTAAALGSVFLIWSAAYYLWVSPDA
jgi:hypothetical protein